MRGKEIRRQGKKRNEQPHLVVHVCATSLAVHYPKLLSASFYSAAGMDLQKNLGKPESMETKLERNIVGPKQIERS
jgi:hypothetical protein